MAPAQRHRRQNHHGIRSAVWFLPRHSVERSHTSAGTSIHRKSQRSSPDGLEWQSGSLYSVAIGFQENQR